MHRFLALSSLAFSTACSGSSESPAPDAEPSPAEEAPTPSPAAVLSEEAKAAQWAIAEHLNMPTGDQLNLSVELSPNTQSYAVARAPVGGLCVSAYKSPSGEWVVSYMGTTPPASPIQLQGAIPSGSVGAMADKDEVPRMFERCLNPTP